jgi:succinoglycan biosynthesis protein ExoA
MSPQAVPFVTVIVPVRNEGKCIERTITKLARQSYPADRFEIIVADGLSTDDTVAIVRGLQDQFDNIRLISNPRQLSSAARNLGIHFGKGDYFIVVDGHCDIDDQEYLRKMVSAFAKSGADCLGRPQPLEVDGASLLQEAVALARRSWFGHNPDSHIYSAQSGFVKASSVAVAYSRHVFEAVGGFDERFDACEDVEFNHRVDEAGLKCWFAPDIAVHYHPRTSIRALMRQMSRYGHGRIRLASKHPRSLTGPALAPMTFWASMIACGLLAFWSRPFAFAFTTGCAAYLAVTAIAIAMLLRKPGRIAAKCWLPIVFPAIHLGFAWGSFVEILRVWPGMIVSAPQRWQQASRQPDAAPRPGRVESSNLQISHLEAARSDTHEGGGRAAA